MNIFLKETTKLLGDAKLNVTSLYWMIVSNFLREFSQYSKMSILIEFNAFEKVLIFKVPFRVLIISN